MEEWTKVLKHPQKESEKAHKMTEGMEEVKTNNILEDMKQILGTLTWQIQES